MPAATNLPLPPVAQAIAEAIGLDGLLALVDAKGGQTVTIPTRHSSDHPLAVTLGAQRFRLLQQTFAGERIEVPLLRGYRTAILHASVRAERSEATANALAQRFGLTQRHIKRICASAEEADRRQGDLFD